MYRLIHLLGLAGSLVVVARAQTAGTPFCGAGPAPTVSDCQDAVNKVDTARDYHAESVQAGDCSIDIVIDPGTNGAGTSAGADVKSAAQGIVDSCNAIGWEYDPRYNNVSYQSPFYLHSCPRLISHLQISISQCQVCMYGSCAVCNAPSAKEMMMKKSRGARPLLDLERPKAPLHKAKRQDNCPSPPGLPDVHCCGAFQAKSDDCIALGNSLKGQTLTTPYTATSGSCELAIEASTPGFVVQGDDVGQRIIDDTPACDEPNGNTQIVGKVADYGAPDYQFYFGQLCGEFGFGYAGCTP